MVVQEARRRRRGVVPAIVAVVLAFCSGCGGSGSQPSAKSSPASASAAAAPSATASPDSKETAASKAAVTAYLGYIQAYAAASQVPDPDYPGLFRYVNQPLLSRTRHALQSLKDSGELQVGAQTATVTGTTVDLAASQPSVTIRACLDYSSLRLVYKASRSPVPNSQIKTPRVSAIVTVWLFVNGQWMVSDTRDGTDSC
jgi:hypothetical protein